MYPNLLAEMARNGLKTRDIALIINCSAKTANNKLQGRTEFTLPEIRKILERFGCEGKDVDRLFAIKNGPA